MFILGKSGMMFNDFSEALEICKSTMGENMIYVCHGIYKINRDGDVKLVSDDKIQSEE